MHPDQPQLTALQRCQLSLVMAAKGAPLLPSLLLSPPLPPLPPRPRQRESALTSSSALSASCVGGGRVRAELRAKSYPRSLAARGAHPTAPTRDARDRAARSRFGDGMGGRVSHAYEPRRRASGSCCENRRPALLAPRQTAESETDTNPGHACNSLPSKRSLVRPRAAKIVAHLLAAVAA